ncbi:two component transcriptional regulator, LytTR family [Niastella koreensis GR20-10]|uniref:Two component transcriptional regulator, LytTR family n=2 Tax=Niastella koreensis TaxID=354356 RepID=G8TQV6_NIAKG|nr:LytTR family DNA-binding domain-containing protein [Niastella koreensis]AEV97855.1 two component transcriptional regulator, LytTR family [Niastella koreensis GR20-10]
MMRCIAVDDEKWVLDLLVDNISRVPFLQLVGRCKNALEATELLHREVVDLIFLDIQMPGLDGIQFVQSLQHPPMIIFVTAYKEHAWEGFELAAVDYLLKPVSFERFLKACNKAQELFRLQQKATTPKELPASFFVYVEYNQVKINISEIVYIEGMKDYVKIYLISASKPVITKMSLKALEDKLLPYRLVRIHKSYIIAADKVTAVKRDLICLGSVELPLSESYRAAVEAVIPLNK